MAGSKRSLCAGGNRHIRPQPVDPSTTPANPGEEQNTMRPKKTILCVDDNEQLLSVRKFMLETRGYRVIAVAEPRAALEHLQTAAPGSVDLLLSDVLLPHMDGNELVRRAKQLHPALPSLLVSGTVTNFDRALAADAFLPKGACTAAEMLDRIKILVARKRGPKKAVAVPPPLPAASVTAADVVVVVDTVAA
jgi:two-component system response regulator CpxR